MGRPLLCQAPRVAQCDSWQGADDVTVPPLLYDLYALIGRLPLYRKTGSGKLQQLHTVTTTSLWCTKVVPTHDFCCDVKASPSSSCQIKRDCHFSKSVYQLLLLAAGCSCWNVILLVLSPFCSRSTYMARALRNENPVPR